MKWHDERSGLPDDWITALACVDGTVNAGAFVGGLAAWDGAHWRIVPALQGENVMALAPDGDGSVFISTRTGLWHRDKSGSRFLDSEIQALCRDRSGLWIGTRTGLFFYPDSSLR